MQTRQRARTESRLKCNAHILGGAQLVVNFKKKNLNWAVEQKRSNFCLHGNFTSFSRRQSKFNDYSNGNNVPLCLSIQKKGSGYVVIIMS